MGLAKPYVDDVFMFRAVIASQLPYDFDRTFKGRRKAKAKNPASFSSP